MTQSALPYHSPPVDPPRDTAAADTLEPFGQMGVRQFAGRVLRAIFICVCFISLALGRRSDVFDDLLKWSSAGQALSIRSQNGVLFVKAIDSPTRTSPSPGWLFYTNYTNAAQDDWAPSLWKTIGLEVGLQPKGANTAGFWISVKWSLIALLAAIQPVISLGMALVRRLAYRD